MAEASSPKIKGTFKSCLKPGMNRPHDVICHQGHYVMTDTFNNRVIVVNPADNSVEELCNKKQGGLSSNMRPYAIVALSDTKRDFLFTDTANRCVLRYEDNVCRMWSEAELPQNGRPTGVAVDSGGLVYVADCENRCIRVYSESGQYVRSFGSVHLQSPWFLKFNSQGNLFVTDNQSGMKVFTKEGLFVKKLNVRSENKSWACRGIAIDKYDNIFITARSKSSVRLLSREKVVVFGPNHTVIASLGGLMQFNYIRGVCCDYDNNKLVVVDGEWHRLQLYSLYEHRQECLPSSTSKTVAVPPSDEYDEEESKTEEIKDPKESDDFESGATEDCAASYLSLFDDQEDEIRGDEDDDDKSHKSGDDYDYDYSHLELFKQENYNITTTDIESKITE